MGINFNQLINVTLPNFSSDTLSIGLIISRLFPYLFGIIGFLLLGLLVFGGYEVLISQGDPKKMALGRDRITQAILGFIVVFAAYWIVKLAGAILDIQAITEIFGP